MNVSLMIILSLSLLCTMCTSRHGWGTIRLFRWPMRWRWRMDACLWHAGWRVPQWWNALTEDNDVELHTLAYWSWTITIMANKWVDKGASGDVQCLGNCDCHGTRPDLSQAQTCANFSRPVVSSGNTYIIYMNLRVKLPRMKPNAIIQNNIHANVDVSLLVTADLDERCVKFRYLMVMKWWPTRYGWKYLISWYLHGLLTVNFELFITIHNPYSYPFFTSCNKRLNGLIFVPIARSRWFQSACISVFSTLEILLKEINSSPISHYHASSIQSMINSRLRFASRWHQW